MEPEDSAPLTAVVTSVWIHQNMDGSSSRPEYVTGQLPRSFFTSSHLRKSSRAPPVWQMTPPPLRCSPEAR
ncbi:unnamed protein product [Gadus morhua 'NCC']